MGRNNDEKVKSKISRCGIFLDTNRKCVRQKEIFNFISKKEEWPKKNANAMKETFRKDIFSKKDKRARIFEKVVQKTRTKTKTAVVAAGRRDSPLLECFEMVFTKNQVNRNFIKNIFSSVHYLSHKHCLSRGYNQTDFGGLNLTELGLTSINKQGGNDDFGDDNDDNDDDENLPNTNLISGDERLVLYREMLNSFVWERQDIQVDFHEMMIKTALPCIFTKEWDTDYDRILRIFGLYVHCAETFIVCPRRFGKTVAVAMFCATYMYVIPNASIAIFSTAQRTSGKMMVAIFEFMRELPYFRDAIFEIKNSETICISLYGNKRTMWCYPGKVGVWFYFNFCLFFCCYMRVIFLRMRVCVCCRAL